MGTDGSESSMSGGMKDVHVSLISRPSVGLALGGELGPAGRGGLVLVPAICADSEATTVTPSSRSFVASAMSGDLSNG